MPMITDITPHELSLIFREHKGEKWAPVNGDARVLAVKGAKEVTDDEKKGWLSKLVDAVKGWYIADDGASYGPTNDEATNAACSLIWQMFYDLQNATCISNDTARDAAVTSIVKEFFSMAAQIGSGSEKAGKRHSTADQARIDAMRSKLGELTSSVATITEALDGLGVAETEGEKGDVLVVDVDYQKACQEIGCGHYQGDTVAKADSDKEGKYGDVEYADTKNKKYPIDTKEHAKAAWSYINQEKNADKYSADDLAKIRAKIKAACEKFGIDVESDKGAASSETGVVSDDVAKAQIEALKSEFKAQLDEAVTAIKSESDAALAAIQGELDSTKAKLDEANNSIATMVKGAMKPSSPGAVPTRNEDGSMHDPADPNGAAKEAAHAEALKGAKTIAEVVRLQGIGKT